VAGLLGEELLCDSSGEVKDPTASDRPQVLKAILPTAERSMEPGLMTQHMLPGSG